MAIFSSSTYRPGRHFLQIPGPTNVPDRILRAIDRPVIDHRGPDFSRLGLECLEGMKAVFKTKADPVFIYPASGTGAWEAAIANTLSPGDRVLMFETGQFAALWRKMGDAFGLEVIFVPGDWRHGIDPNLVEEKLRQDTGHRFKAVMCVHNEILDRHHQPDRTHAGQAMRIGPAIRPCSWSTRCPPWPAPTTATTSGGWMSPRPARKRASMMLPPGTGIQRRERKGPGRLQVGQAAALLLVLAGHGGAQPNGLFSLIRPAINLLFGLRESIRMLVEEEGLANVFRRHARLAEATPAGRCGPGGSSFSASRRSSTAIP